jgi:anti-sigma factor RsiW
MVVAMTRSMSRRFTGGRWPAMRSGEQLACAEVARLLQQYLDGELGSDTEIGCLSAHLDACRRCGLEADTYRTIKTALAHRADEIPPESIARVREFGRSLIDGN